jgi:hypothetical protein
MTSPPPPRHGGVPAEAYRFDSLALLDRLAFDTLTALAALAGATTNIRLQTEVLLGPLRDTELLAKQVATRTSSGVDGSCSASGSADARMTILRQEHRSPSAAECLRRN